MAESFAETLRRLRKERGASQQQLADALYVDRSTVASWETGRRVPETQVIISLARQLGVDVSVLVNAVEEEPEAAPNVMLVDDERIIRTGTLNLLRETLPRANVVDFGKGSEALDFARGNDVALAFLDIELGAVSGLDLCRSLLAVRPRANVVFLTAYREYAFDAWETGAAGFLLKPLTAEAVRAQLAHLRYPVRGLESV